MFCNATEKQSAFSKTISRQTAIQVHNLGKCYRIYARPRDRLLQMLPGWRKSCYQEFWALQHLSFDVPRGETVGIIGRNGSGKSTLLQLVCGTLHPTCGEIHTQGRIAALLELGSGFNPEFTGRENVYLNATILGLSKAEIDARYDDIAAFADIGEFIDQLVKTYSTGMFVRLAFSIAINVRPDILVVDEALAVGDARFQAKCMNRIKRLQQDGVTLLFVSHDVGAVRILCQRALWIDHGGLKMDGDVFPVTGSYMEYLFSDSDERAVSQPHSGMQLDPSVGQAPPDSEPSCDAKPVTHWGSDIGCIQYAAVFNLDGRQIDLVELGEMIEVRIAFIPPPRASRQYLAVSFSIKDLKGTDLIVSSTYEAVQVSFLNQEAPCLVCYRFRNPLVTGKYVLVGAVEDRSSATIHYYEYIEGTHYFASSSGRHTFGIFQPAITQRIEVLR